MAKTLYQKILDTHVVKQIDDSTVLLYVDMHFANEYTSPQAFAGLSERGVTALVPDAHFCVVDHIIPSADVSPRVIADAASLRQAETLEANCRRHGIDAFYGANDPHQGIEHVVVAEQGLVRPGMVVICGDSHTTTHGALGALGFGIGTSEIEHILATQTLVYRLAKTMLIRIDGELPVGSTAKDLALTVLRTISARGALGHVVEYQGRAIEALSVEGRMTLCNLTVEAGARGALIAPDDKTIAWVRAHAPDLTGDDIAAAQDYWATLAPDPDAVYDRTVTLDASHVKPMVTWGTSPDQCSAIDEPIPTPTSFEDPIARSAAEILKGRHVAPGVCAQVVPGSMQVRQQAEKEGIAQIFKDAGFEWRKSGCSLCLCMNDDILEAGVRCASTTNRNFEGRQGRGARTHLVSPQMAAAAAVMGKFVDWRRL